MARDPKKINSYIIIDFETGGLDRKEGLHAKKYPVTEFAALAINGVNLQEIIKYDNLVKPYDNSLIYDPQAATATGINRELCEAEGIPLRTLVDDIILVIEEANLYGSKTARPIFVAHNWPFDRGFLMEIFRRAGKDLSKLVNGGWDNFGNFIPQGIDTIELAKNCWAEITENTTKYNLGACCLKAGVNYVDGHRAMNDVIPTADLFRYFSTRLRSGSGDTVSVDHGNIVVHRKGFEW
jgi:DNA polymerase III epsilon subunit-like protein